VGEWPRYRWVTGEHDALLGPGCVEEFQGVLRAELDRAMGAAGEAP
jgi:hypothetical protein